MIYIKLKAQRLLIGQNAKAFLASVLPFFMIISLTGFNYYSLIYLKNNSELNLVLKTTLATLILVFSAFLESSVMYMREIYFYRNTTDTVIPVRAQDLACAFVVLILKSLLFFTWLAIFFLPSAVLMYLAVSVKDTNYPNDISLTLAVSSLVMAIVGIGCLFVTQKRYSKSYFIQFHEGETNPIKVLARSINAMEGSQRRYSLFCLSFLGWDILCLLLFPIIYVLPYRKSAKYVFFTEKPKQKQIIKTDEKPIVFIFSNS